MPETPEAHTPRFLAWLYSTPSQQPVLAALCALEREIGASLRPGTDHHVAHTRLEWWRGECARCAAGNPVHPLTRELRSLTDSPLLGLSGLVDAATWDLAGATFERREELTGYCERWAAAMIAPLAGEADAPALGTALRELELLGQLAGDARAGRLRVPLDELAQAGVAPEALAAPPWPQGLADVLRARHQLLRAQLAAVVGGLPHPSQQGVRGLLVWAALSFQESQRAERALPRARTASIATAAATSWRAWRAARAAAGGRLRLR